METIMVIRTIDHKKREIIYSGSGEIKTINNGVTISFENNGFKETIRINETSAIIYRKGLYETIMHLHLDANRRSYGEVKSKMGDLSLELTALKIEMSEDEWEIEYRNNEDDSIITFKYKLLLH